MVDNMVFIHGASCAHLGDSGPHPREYSDSGDSGCLALSLSLEVDKDVDGDALRMTTKSARWHLDLAELMLGPSRPCYPVERGADVAAVFMWRPYVSTKHTSQRPT